MSNEDIGKNAEDLKEALQRILQQAQTNIDTDIFKQDKKIDSFITKPSTDNKTLKTLVAIKTGTMLDDKFINIDDKVIDGVPFGTSNICLGLPSTGKSIFYEELCLQLANRGHRVCYVVTEELWRSNGSRLDLESRMREKASILKLDWSKIAENLHVLDCVFYSELRDFSTFVASFKSLVEDKNIDILIIDSLTLLEDSRGKIKDRLLELSKYCQLHNVTSFFISQRATDDSDGFSASGGLSLIHIVDTVFLMDTKKAWSGDVNLKADTGCKQGDTVNFFRIIKSRLSRYKGNYYGYTISNDGLVVQTTVPQSK